MDILLSRYFCTCDVLYVNFFEQLYRGRHASKITEEEEDEEYLKEEEDGLAGSGGTRLVSQPSCECYFEMLLADWFSLFLYARIVLHLSTWFKFEDY